MKTYETDLKELQIRLAVVERKTVSKVFESDTTRRGNKAREIARPEHDEEVLVNSRLATVRRRIKRIFQGIDEVPQEQRSRQ